MSSRDSYRAPSSVLPQDAISKVIASYSSRVVRSYAWGRFQILRQRFLAEIGQYLPESGDVLDVGCGFGLFGLYFAQTQPGIRLQGYDLDQKRIKEARAAARKLGIDNAVFDVGDARNLNPLRPFETVYMMDIVHHIPKPTVAPLITNVADSLSSGGRLLIKDIDRSPAWQRMFAHALDIAMSPTSPVNYWEPTDLAALLDECGFDVVRHAMVDILPYPHLLYVATKR